MGIFSLVLLLKWLLLDIKVWRQTGAAVTLEPLLLPLSKDAAPLHCAAVQFTAQFCEMRHLRTVTL